jgi:hypothetical protein
MASGVGGAYKAVNPTFDVGDDRWVRPVARSPRPFARSVKARKIGHVVRKMKQQNDLSKDPTGDQLDARAY